MKQAGKNGKNCLGERCLSASFRCNYTLNLVKSKILGKTGRKGKAVNPEINGFSGSEQHAYFVVNTFITHHFHCLLQAGSCLLGFCRQGKIELLQAHLRSSMFS